MRGTGRSSAAKRKYPRVPPRNHFEMPRGNLAGFHSVRVDNQWRPVLRWISDRGEAEGGYLDDRGYR
jgi:toxin HigB-1